MKNAGWGCEKAAPMRAMVLRKFAPAEAGPLDWTEIDIPRTREDEILVRIRYCAVCHTDLHTVEGDLPEARLPVIPGHQVIGEVEAAGAKTYLFKPGDRAGVAWLNSSCGACRFCLSGHENLCEAGRFTGYHVHGGYADYIAVRESFAYRIPERFPDEEAAPLLCAGIIGYRALRLSGIAPKERLGLFGFGASAHVAIQVARYWGCEVYVFSRSAEHRALARELGASWTGTAREDPPAKIQSAVIFAPAGELVPAALDALDKGGTVALAGISMTSIPELEYEKHLYREKILRSVANATRADGTELLRLASEIPIKTKIELFPLREANRALLLLKQGKINGAAVLRISGG